jgi:hypothetical protein
MTGVLYAVGGERLPHIGIEGQAFFAAKDAAVAAGSARPGS